MDRKIDKKTWTPKRIALILGGAVLVPLLVFGILVRSGESRLNVDAERLTISEVRYDAFQEFIPVNGTVLPVRTIFLDAVEGGRVEEIFVEEGSYVQEGQPILELTNNNLQLNLMSQEARLFEQINFLRNTRIEMERTTLSLQQQLVELDYRIRQQQRLYDRNKSLAEKNLIAEEEFEDIQSELDYLLSRRELTLASHRQDSLLRQVQVEQLEQSVNQMQRNLAMVKENLANLNVRAPIDGQLTMLDAEIGELKVQGQRLGQVDVLDGYRIRVAIDEHYIARVTTGQQGTFDFAGSTHQLSVTRVYPEVREGRFEVDMQFTGDQPDGLRRGQTVRIRFELDAPLEAVLLPRGGFFQRTGGNWVYVVDASGSQAVKRNIRLGRQNPQFFEVLEGLEPGDRVITSNYEVFGDKDRLVLR